MEGLDDLVHLVELSLEVLAQQSARLALCHELCVVARWEGLSEMGEHVLRGARVLFVDLDKYAQLRLRLRTGSDAWVEEVVQQLYCMRGPEHELL